MHDTKRCWKCSLFGQTIIYMSGFIMFYLLRALYSFWGHFFDDAFPPNADAEEVAASLSQAGLVFLYSFWGHFFDDAFPPNAEEVAASLPQAGLVF